MCNASLKNGTVLREREEGGGRGRSQYRDGNLKFFAGLHARGRDASESKCACYLCLKD